MGEISDLVLRPHAVTNITFPIQLLSDISNDNNTDKNKTAGMKNNNSAFRSIANDLCLEEDRAQKEIDIVYDIMPTLRFGDYGSLSLSFTGQATKMSCEKVFIYNYIFYVSHCIHLTFKYTAAEYGQQILNRYKLCSQKLQKNYCDTFNKINIILYNFWMSFFPSGFFFYIYFIFDSSLSNLKLALIN